MNDDDQNPDNPGGGASARRNQAGHRTITAPNPGPMTLEGTNTQVVGTVVIDPGPRDEQHLASVLRAAGEVSLVLLTHGHADHREGAGRLAELAECPVRAYDEQHCRGAAPLTDGAVVGGLSTVTTPGHTWDSVSFWWPENGVLFSGDTVLGRGTTMVAHPDGALGAYLASLRRLLDMARAGDIARILPGHGPPVDDPAGVLEYYLEHREQRLEQVREALRAGDETARDVVRRVYADVDPALWPAAEQSVRAQLDYLRSRGDLLGGPTR